MKKALFILGYLLMISSNAYTQDDKEYSRKLKQLFEVSGTEETYEAVIIQMFTMFKQQNSMVDANVWSDLRDEFLDTSIRDLVRMLVPVYQKHLNLADLEALIDFYKSPVGKKYAKKIPVITQESMLVGQEWGMEISKKFEQKLKEKGY